MNNEKENKSNKAGNLILIIGFIMAISAICLFIFNIPGIWAQLLAVISSAFLGAGATSWMTNHLLERQTEAEEEMKKNIKIHQSKINVYSEFIREVWNQAAESDTVDKEALKPIRSLIFNKLIFYLDKKKLAELKELFKNNLPKDRIQLYAQITDIVRRDVDNNNENKLKKEKLNELETYSYLNLVKDLWNAISNKIDNEQDEKTIHDYSFKQAWHFTMFDNEQIDEAFIKNKYELSLIEYGETWRTNRVKQVKQGDIVFLFRRGGPGYIGVFIVKGWRVFYFEENREEIQLFDTDKPKEVKGEQYETDIKEYDIYYSKDDGATLCANIIVEPIAFDYEGVKYPGGVYRHTIARYDNRYARTLLQRFLRNQEDNKPSYNKLFENIEMARVNTNKFNEIIKKLHILPAEKDENGNWKEVVKE